jgi:hypothetical protein
MKEAVTHNGWKFGTLQVMDNLRADERLTDCCKCGGSDRVLVQFRYCGTAGALCEVCLRSLAHSVIKAARATTRVRWDS